MKIEDVMAVVSSAPVGAHIINHTDVWVKVAHNAWEVLEPAPHSGVADRFTDRGTVANIDYEWEKHTSYWEVF